MSDNGEGMSNNKLKWVKMSNKRRAEYEGDEQQWAISAAKEIVSDEQ